eukprot:1964726-Rhodomonas_salina.6
MQDEATADMDRAHCGRRELEEGVGVSAGGVVWRAGAVAWRATPCLCPRIAAHHCKTAAVPKFCATCVIMVIWICPPTSRCKPLGQIVMASVIISVYRRATVG